MNDVSPSSGSSRGAAVIRPKPSSRLTPQQWRQIVLISLAAIGGYLGVRQLPTGTNLMHGDFSVAGGNSIELCDPSNPQFIPVVAVRSPVTLTLAPQTPVIAGREVNLALTLVTATGKPIGPVDLLEGHTKKLHLLIADESLTDYQHVHPVPGRKPGEWLFSFHPRFAGVYRVFADFIPTATARGLYASADLVVAADPTILRRVAKGDETIAPVVSDRSAGLTTPGGFVPFAFDGLVATLSSSIQPIRARQVADLAFRLSRTDGGSIEMQPVMGAYAHLVAFDAKRSGFAHLHPNEVDLNQPPDRLHPQLTFKVTIPQAGRYVIWAQIALAGRERFVPFWFDVVD